MDKYRIMIVDDETDVRDGIVEHIDWDALGFEVAAVAENGQEALDKAENCELDVVLTDIKMPFMDGLTMCERLSHTDPAVKFIILTGFDEFEYAQSAVRLHVAEYVLKPVNVEELTEVLRRIKNVLDDNAAQMRDIEALREKYNSVLPRLRERVLNDLIWGTLTPNAAAEQFERYRIGLGKNQNCVASIFEVRRGQEEPAIAWELVPLSVRQTINEQFRGLCEYEVLIGSAELILLASWQEENPIEQMISIANKICMECRRVLGVEVTAGIGRCGNGIMSLHESYNEAKSALEYRSVVGGGAIYIQDMEQNSREPVTLESSERTLLSAIKFGSRDQIEVLVRDILYRISQRDEWGQKTGLLSVFNAVYGIASGYDLHSDEQVNEALRSMMCLPDDWRADGQTEARLTEACVMLSENITEHRQTATKALADRAKKFINENYSDSGLSVDKLCSHLHISQSYFSTLFRTETGVSYIQYLTEVRMNKALTLLQETDTKTYLIANEVGYDDPNYFSHVFKKRFGVSPVKYRKEPNSIKNSEE